MSRARRWRGGLKARRTELTSLLAEIDEPSIVTLPPSAAAAYSALASRLHEALEEAVRTELRKLVESVDFVPLEGLGKFDLQVQGSLAALLGLSQARNARIPAA